MRSAVFSGAQLEASDTPTSYIPTESTAVTHAADRAFAIDLSGFDLSGGYTASIAGRLEGVASNARRLLQIDNGESGNRHLALYNSVLNEFRGEVWEDNAIQAISGSTVSSPLPSDFRCAWSVGPNIYDFALDGEAYGHDETVDYVVPTRAALGHDGSGTSAPARLRLSRVSLYPSVMTAAQLTEVTA